MRKEAESTTRDLLKPKEYTSNRKRKKGHSKEVLQNLFPKLLNGYPAWFILVQMPAVGRLFDNHVLWVVSCSNSWSILA